MNALPQRTRSQAARTLHALLRHCPGYTEACRSPAKVAWTVQSLLLLHTHQHHITQQYLPAGCIGGAQLLAEALPLQPRYSNELTMETICLLIIHLGYYCRQLSEYAVLTSG